MQIPISGLHRNTIHKAKISIFNTGVLTLLKYLVHLNNSEPKTILFVDRFANLRPVKMAFAYKMSNKQALTNLDLSPNMERASTISKLNSLSPEEDGLEPFHLRVISDY